MWTACLTLLALQAPSSLISLAGARIKDFTSSVKSPRSRYFSNTKTEEVVPVLRLVAATLRRISAHSLLAVQWRGFSEDNDSPPLFSFLFFLMALNSTDWAYPTTVTGTGWTSVSGSLATDVKLDDNTNMAFHTYPVRATNPLICSAWETAPATALVIPPGATPVGLEVALQGYGNGASLPGTPLQIGAAFSKDGVTMIGDTKTIDVLEYLIGNPQPVQYLGGSSELWGAGWTDVEAEGNSLFLFYQQGATTGRYVDYVAMRIWYTDGTVITPGGLCADNQSRYIPGMSVKGGRSLVIR